MPLYQQNNLGPVGYGQFAPQNRGYNAGGGQPDPKRQALQQALGKQVPGAGAAQPDPTLMAWLAQFGRMR